ncbi:Odorant receptor 47a, partial [Pseudolycoriella hygida]
TPAANDSSSYLASNGNAENKYTKDALGRVHRLTICYSHPKTKPSRNKSILLTKLYSYSVMSFGFQITYRKEVLLRLCLSSIGYSFENNESRLRQVYSLLMWMLLFVLVFPEIHFVVENISNIPLATDALCPLLTSILSLSKVMTLYFKKNGFYRIIKQLDDMWMKSSESDRLILQKGHKIDKRLTLTYLISSVSVAILYLLFPIVKAIFELQSTGSTVWIMPMRSIFLYDISVSPNYYLTYLWFIQSTYLAAIGSVGIDCLFYGSAFNISSHFEIIQRKVRNRTFDSTQHDDINERRVTPENFFGIINYHQQVLSICKEFQRLYSVVLFTQFLITSVQLCVIAFQLTL